jgi:hypothetical protein
LEELDQRNLWRVKILNNAIKDEIVWWGTLHFEISTRATPGISASMNIQENIVYFLFQPGVELRFHSEEWT